MLLLTCRQAFDQLGDTLVRVPLVELFFCYRTGASSHLGASLRIICDLQDDICQCFSILGFDVHAEAVGFHL